MFEVKHQRETLKLHSGSFSSLLPLSVQGFCPSLNAFSHETHHFSWGAQLCLAGSPGYQRLLLKVYSQVLPKDNGMLQVFKLRLLPELKLSYPPQTFHIAFESPHRTEHFNKLILMINVVSELWNIVEPHFKIVVWEKN